MRSSCGWPASQYALGLRALEVSHLTVMSPVITHRSWRRAECEYCEPAGFTWDMEVFRPQRMEAIFQLDLTSPVTSPAGPQLRQQC